MFVITSYTLVSLIYLLLFFLGGDGFFAVSPLLRFTTYDPQGVVFRDFIGDFFFISLFIIFIISFLFSLGGIITFIFTLHFFRNYIMKILTKPFKFWPDFTHPT